MYRTLLVHAAADADAGPRLAVARALAERFSAHVIGVAAAAWEPFQDVGVGYAGAEAFTIMLEDCEAQVADAAKAFDAVFAGHQAGAGCRTEIAYPDQALAQAARAGDLILVGVPHGRYDNRRVPNPGRVVMEAGCPVLLCPAGTDRLSADAVLVGWKNTRESRRAVADALPFLKAARSVVVAAVCETASSAAVESEVTDVIARLERHGVKAAAHVSPQVKASVAADLSSLADHHGADLLVLGGYGHSRLREWAFGGVTQDLLLGSRKFVLFSH